MRDLWSVMIQNPTTSERCHTTWILDELLKIGQNRFAVDGTVTGECQYSVISKRWR